MFSIFVKSYIIVYKSMKYILIFCLLFISIKISAQIEGYACIYSKSLCGGKTADGKRLNCDALTAAHLKYAFGTKVRVTHLKNGNSVIVTINDRGPYTKKFMIDLSPAAAKAIGLTYKQGIAKVKIEKL
jgi:rare lipoprotein A